MALRHSIPISQEKDDPVFSVSDLRVYMGQLHRKLEADPARPRYLVTEPGVGYWLKTE